MHRLRPPWHPSHPGGEKSNSTILKCFFFLRFKGSCDLLEGVNNPLNRISIGHDSWPIEFCSGDYWHFPNIWSDNYLRRWSRTCSLVEISPLLEVDLWSQKLQKLSKQKMAGNVIPKKYFHWFIKPVYNIIPLESGEFYHGFDWCGEECICLGTLSLMNCVFKINTFLWICCFLYSEGSNIFYRHFPRHSVVCARLSDPLIENVNTSKGSTCWKGRTCSLSNKMNKLIIIQDNWIVW